MSTLPPHAMATPISDEVDTSTMTGEDRPSLRIWKETQRRNSGPTAR
jgi:hypothetical protein